MRVERGDGRSAAMPRGGAVTIGNFDGLHRGQQELVRHVVRRAAALGAPAVVLSFDPHPLAVLAPEREPRRLASERQRQARLAALGVDLLWLVPFDRELAAWEPERFVRELLVERLGVAEVAVGARFRFGRERAGDVAALRRMGARFGFSAVGLDEQADGDGTLSSTRVRGAVAAGEVERAAGLLGRPYAVDGVVVHGDRLGRQIGWPTANVAPAEARQLLPAAGVYAATLSPLDETRSYPGAANLGVRPTRGAAGATTLEIHLLDFDGDLYGRQVEVGFERRLRAERRFDGLDALREQIGRDVEQAREYFRRPSR
ncbi:MAG: bifunctional riboflavin kinase/FAD synthetase [Thermoanaerobaculia bacterium]|nr:bifunctional riboflavin kinase/FAD synthetase [Thermoanaerobaculia bacterium]